MSFSPSDEAFEGFRLVRRAPVILVLWTLVYAAASLIIFATMGGGIANLMSVSARLEQSQPSLQELADLGQAFSSMILVGLPLMVAVGTVLNTAVVRSVLHPEQKAYGYMRLGMDELRVLAATLLTGIAMFAIVMGLYMVVGGLGVTAYATGQAWLWLPTILGGLGAIALVAWLSVRWCLAVPLVFAEKRIAPFASFAVTKPHFWPLLGMALLAAVMSLLVSLLMSVVSAPVALVLGDLSSLAAFEGQSTAAILTRAWPMLLGWSVVSALSSVLQLAVLYAPFTAAYAAIKGGRTGAV